MLAGCLIPATLKRISSRTQMAIKAKERSSFKWLDQIEGELQACRLLHAESEVRLFDLSTTTLKQSAWELEDVLVSDDMKATLNGPYYQSY